MAKKKPLVVITRKLPDAIETRLMELFAVRLNVADEAMSEAELTDAIKKWLEKNQDEAENVHWRSIYFESVITSIENIALLQIQIEMGNTHLVYHSHINTFIFD